MLKQNMAKIRLFYETVEFKLRSDTIGLNVFVILATVYIQNAFLMTRALSTTTKTSLWSENKTNMLALSVSVGYTGTLDMQPNTI